MHNNEHTSEYFFIRGDDNRDNLPYLRPDNQTSQRRFRDVAPEACSAPLAFDNALKDDFRSANIKEMVGDVLFEGNNFLVRRHIHERLLTYNIRDIFTHPAVYIDDLDNRNDDFWYVGFTARLDCWDRSMSSYSSPPLKIGDKEYFDMYSYILDAKVLDGIPLEERLMFQMGGTQDAMIACHKSIAGIFRENGRTGAMLQRVNEY